MHFAYPFDDVAVGSHKEAPRFLSDARNRGNRVSCCNNYITKIPLESKAF